MRLAFYILYYGIGKTLFTLIFRVIFRTTVRGLDRLPRTDGLLVLCNHISFVDPPLLIAVVPRPVEFMTMAEMFRRPWLAKLLRIVGCFPVDRSRADSSSAREAVRRLRAGRCVVIFPEAGIRLGEKSVLGGDPTFKPGAGLIAELGQAAILPVIVRDTRTPYHWRNWLRRGRLSITFGHPFCLWLPERLTVHERRTIARTALRDALLKTVQLD